mmetsp:Transcript_11710/g.25925  ORF Transcript_11710/g.25925 Transcript_11710/m.25925 type:complete len:192 (-) Transcript_11710:126-701(-)|eukprot:CAMPEP_0204273914 /NCGR_PEP_ID=MMETSP0468-20130131/24625_1 /ASSEMBLY_ACC=CAM_ASM_000383 /TAXON_ID=2969 /ORGANISM="Oxyrrhis marina" /LENGTH=191 /DNA_ID=CAMNT_0051250041 /DNA_START=17 /DNA_END=592 /DNA_ORIENTATION=+
MAPKASVGEPQTICIRADGRKKVHTTYPDESEVVEEFDEKTNALLLRKSRKPTAIGRDGEWVTEVGQDSMSMRFDPSKDMLAPSSSNPIFLRKDTPSDFQWRIRNLSYPKSVYAVTCDHAAQQIVVRTENKKYFKRIDVPDLQRASLKLEDGSLTWDHSHNTLVISYKKPNKVVEMEAKRIAEAEKKALQV